LGKSHKPKWRSIDDATSFLEAQANEVKRENDGKLRVEVAVLNGELQGDRTTGRKSRKTKPPKMPKTVRTVRGCRSRD
jgi:hypothetical protein